jgi:hypothetical protein
MKSSLLQPPGIASLDLLNLRCVRITRLAASYKGMRNTIRLWQSRILVLDDPEGKITLAAASSKRDTLLLFDKIVSQSIITTN